MAAKPPYVITRDKLLTESEISKLLKTCRERATADLRAGRITWLMRSALVHIALGSGLKVSEIAVLKVGSLHLSHRNPYLVVLSKTGKKREVYLDNDLVDSLKNFIEQKKTVFKGSIDPVTPLFAGRNGAHITPTALEISWCRAVKDAGMRHCPISSARHTRAAKILSDTGDLRYVQGQLGFASITYPAYYADIRPAKNDENSYSQAHCYQYQRRLENLEEDLNEAGLTLSEAQALKVTDFAFDGFDTEGNSLKKKEVAPILAEIKAFVERHEWLGTMPLHPTHYFTSRYHGILTGVIIYDMPVTFSKLLGNNTRKMERLISRGACISLSPKGLASSLLMYSIKWMVQHTRYRLFVAYADPEAMELGVIYQSCNFFYAGKASGSKKRYMLPSGKWVSDRYFTTRSVYKRMADKLGIAWKYEWSDNGNIKWDNIPNKIEESIRKAAKEFMTSCESRIVPPKHKYAYILGLSKKETKTLIQIFVYLNPHLFYEVVNKDDSDSNHYVNHDIRERHRTGDTECKYRKRIPYPKIRGE